MKSNLLSLLILVLVWSYAPNTFAKGDTTLVYCNASLNKVKKKYASYYAKVFENGDGTVGVKQFKMNGTPFMLGSFKSKKLETKEGVFIYFDHKGKTKKTGTYEGGLKTGLWKYYSSEKLTKEGEYFQDKKHGTWIHYDPNGLKSEVSQYKMGKQDGIYKKWSLETLTVSGQYENDKEVGHWEAWFSNGGKNYEGDYVNGKREGEWKFYFKSGKLAANEIYKDGEPAEIHWYEEDGTEVEAPDTLEREPEFSGGEQAMIMFINENISYPQSAIENGEQGIIYVTFVVNPDGTLTEIEILKGVSDALDNESMRMVKKMPNWIPGMDHNRKLPIRYTLPVHFRLG